MFKLSKQKHIDFTKAYNKANDFIAEIPILKKKRKFFMGIKLLKYASLVVLIIFLSFIIVFISQAAKLKNIYSESAEGKNNLLLCIDSLQADQYKEAKNFADRANKNFTLAKKYSVEMKNNFFVSNFPLIKNDANDIDYLITSGLLLSQAANRGSFLALEFENLLGNGKKLSFSKFSTAEKQAILKKIFQSGPELNGLKSDLDLALLNLDQIKYSGLLFPLEEKIKILEEKIKIAASALAQTIPFSESMPYLSGYPNKSTYLVLLQNSDELRPTGGFLGTYGILEIANGEITRFDTHDIYHLDMPARDILNIEPPGPIKKYLVPKWFMRDANWSPDWPTAAKQIDWFYKKENALLSGKNQINNFNGEFTGFIAITPKFITDLLSIAGPIEIEGVNYDQNNFQEILQYRVEKGFVNLGVPSWQRKEVIGDIAKELKIRLFDLPLTQWKDLASVIIKNVNQKNIIFYASDANIERIIKDQGLGGEIKQPQGDFLMVVDANMGALKTDAVINRSLSYALEERDSNFLAKTTINYAHNGSPDWKTSIYKTYTRVYVPLGSKLKKAIFSNKDVPQNEISVSEEFGKTAYGFYLTIEPGKIDSLLLEYELPKTLVKNNYFLYVQKQPGNNIKELTIDLNFLNIIKSYGPAGFNADRSGKSSIKWETDLMSDKQFEIDL